jgi:hypothetical protein
VHSSLRDASSVFGWARGTLRQCLTTLVWFYAINITIYIDTEDKKSARILRVEPLLGVAAVSI